MSNLNIWADATRPKTLPAAAAPVIMGSAMAFHDGFFDLGLALTTILVCRGGSYDELYNSYL